MTMNTHQTDKIRQSVRKIYGKIARGGTTGCGCDTSSCGSGGQPLTAAEMSDKLGYSGDELKAAPEGANLGLGCGNPQAIAELKQGETVLDLGSGGGFDCFLAARQVGPSGRVIGVDMTPDMVSLARANAGKSDLDNVEFRLGEIEHLPVADNSVDAIISNCVINLSTDKPKVYGEAFRVLGPGGRLAISDIVALRELPPEIQEDLALYAGCVAGAETVKNLERILEELGFTDIRVTIKEQSRKAIREWSQGRGFADYVASATIEAVKPL
jgi:ubiquinone/menaquinone biosynthesis C-methylase UbiE